MDRTNANRTGINNPTTTIQHRKLVDIKRMIILDKEIEQQWAVMPKQAIRFLKETPLDSLNAHSFVKFWSQPTLVEYTRGRRLSDGDTFIGRFREASFSIALNYLKLGKVQEARALILNGTFLIECAVSIRTISSIMSCGLAQ